MGRLLDTTCANYDIPFLRAITGRDYSWYIEARYLYVCNVCMGEIDHRTEIVYESHGIAHINEHPESWNLYVLLLDWGWKRNYETAKYALEQCRGK